MNTREMQKQKQMVHEKFESWDKEYRDKISFGDFLMFALAEEVQAREIKLQDWKIEIEWLQIFGK